MKSGSCLWNFARVSRGAALLLGLLFGAHDGPTTGLGADAFDRLAVPTRALREKLAQDPWRPVYHFVTPEGVCSPFDPNGALFWKGRYHLMYIVQTDQGHCWAHASSLDLLHWRHHPLALEPGEGDAGIFSGGAALDANGVPTITYWGLANPRGICLATSTDELLEHWVKSPHNPVIPETQHGLTVLTASNGKAETVYGAADPSAIWWNDGRYHLLTGNLLVLREFGLKRGLAEHLGDTLYLFSSEDLIHWTYRHPFYRSERRWTREDEDNMCPDFFPLPSQPQGGPPSDRHLLLFISHNLGCQYYVGRYAQDRFEPEHHGRMTWVDNAFFAPESLVDANGRRIMWAWIFDGRSEAARQSSEWSGTLCLPRNLWLGEDGMLRMRPVRELERLRGPAHKFEATAGAAGAEVGLPGFGGDVIELSVEIDPGDAAQCGLVVCRSPDGAEQTLVYYDAEAGELRIDVTRASLAEGPKNVEAAPFRLAPGETLRLRVFVDKSVVEAFANDRQAVMRRIYPSRRDSRGVALFARGGAAQFQAVTGWPMDSPNPY